MSHHAQRTCRALLAIACLTPSCISAQGAGAAKDVRVRVLDVRSRAPIPEVELFASTGVLLGRGDSLGLLRLRIIGTEPFDGRLHRVGFIASSLRVTGHEVGDSVVVLLAPATTTTLDAVEVKASVPVARYADFARRRSSGGPGIFLTDSQITTGGHVRLTDLFRRFPALAVIDSEGTYVITSARSRKPVPLVGKGLDLAPCVFQVMVDDMRMPWGFDVDQLNRGEIHSIEIYPGPATVPVEYRSTSRDAACGLVAIWTKSR